MCGTNSNLYRPSENTCFSDVTASVDGWSGVKLKGLQNDRVIITSDIGNCSISNLQVSLKIDGSHLNLVCQSHI